MKRIDLRGLKLDSTNLSEAVEFAAEAALSKRLCRVYTPGTELAYKCLSDKSLQELINKAELLLPDGTGVVKASRILGAALEGKVAGVEFGEELIKYANDKKLPVKFFFLGGKPEIAEKSGENLIKKYPNVQICGYYHGYFEKSGKESEEIAEMINKSGADIVYVCFGQPAQEKWIDEYATACGASVYAAIGGSFDIYSGTLKRAPKIFIKLGLEWLYRLIIEPWRISRMACLPKYMLNTVIYRIKKGKLK